MLVAKQQPELLLRRLEWTVIRRLDGLLQGDYRTLFRGFGLDLADLREYQVFDDVRHINWNVTARTQVPHVRVYNEDREVTAWFFLDLSPSVDFGSGEISKRQVLAEFTAVLARLLTRQGNRVGAVLFDGVKEHVLPPRNGRGQVLFLIDRIANCPRPPRVPATDLGAALHRSLMAIRRRFVQAAEYDEAMLMAGFARAGMDVLELSTGDDLLDAILRFTGLRKASARMSSGTAP
jgi:uncharacterized protein (DUF58 family)